MLFVLRDSEASVAASGLAGFWGSVSGEATPQPTGEVLLREGNGLESVHPGDLKTVLPWMSSQLGSKRRPPPS